MRKPLKVFTEFAHSLLPNETAYLLSIQKFKDDDRYKILKLVDYNSRNIEEFIPYDTTIDKRKYNHLQNWIIARLKSIDVDEQYLQILEWKRKIRSDSIEPKSEKALLKMVRSYEEPTYYFSEFYELVEAFRQFLLIRLRYSDYQQVDNFIAKHEKTYSKARKIRTLLHEASTSIVSQYSGKGGDSNQWEAWLSDILYDEHLEGHIRYLALVRLVFISHNYRKYDLLRPKLEFLGQKLSEGRFYSKRLLLNYYNNRLMLHSNFREYKKAVYYGYLSIRAKNHDYIFYVNNLCAVLLRTKRNQEALQLMKKVAPDAKKTNNWHNRIGFVAFYIETLNKNGLFRNSEQYGDSFLRGYKKEILQYRWHLFFSVYFEAIFQQGHNEKIIKLFNKYEIRERDKAIRSKANYRPLIPMFVDAALFAEGLLNKVEFMNKLDLHSQSPDKRTKSAIRIILQKLNLHLPKISRRL